MKLRARNTIYLTPEKQIPPGDEFDTDKKTADFLIAAVAADVVEEDIQSSDPLSLEGRGQGEGADQSDAPAEKPVPKAKKEKAAR